MPDVPTTQRAYTLRLSGLTKDDQTWRDALWATHEAVNRGAKVFGDWLLTLRGGLDHRLADERIKTEKGKRDREPTPEERRDRRILLAISWLSVESKNGSPPDHFCISSGIEGETGDTIEALRAILRKRKVPKQEVDSWIADCSSSLKAKIRTDACWVNRSALFDAVTDGWNRTDAREDSRTLLWHVLNDDYLTLPKSKKVAKKKASEEDNDEENSQDKEDRQAAVVKSSRGAANRTRHPFSHLFGAGKPFGKEKKVLLLRSRWLNYLAPQISDAGIQLHGLSEDGKKRARESEGRSTDCRAPTELQREMLSKAASRLAQIWTKQRQQEADRHVRSEAVAKLWEMLHDPTCSSAVALLDAYCEERRIETGALDLYHIRPAQLGGWKQVVSAWAAIEDCNSNRAVKSRIAAAKELQPDVEKFGDINLFMRLAEEDYRPVWWRDGKADPSILESYVKGTKARVDSERLKVAAYRHPDRFLNPVFCQFGTSRPEIKFGRLRQLPPRNGVSDARDTGMLLWHADSNCAKLTILKAISKRFDYEIGSIGEFQDNGDEKTRVSRRGRLSAASVAIPADQPVKVAGVFDAKAVNSRTRSQDEEDDQDGGDTATKGPQWNGTLMANRRSLKAIADLLDSSRRAPNVRIRKTLAERAQKQIRRLRWILSVSMELESRGPWLEFAKKLPAGFNFNVKKHQLYHEENKSRGYRARIALARLPGLRILSVDLGHRYAAACAVWRAVSSKEVQEDCQKHRQPVPTANDLFVCLEQGGKNKKRTLYRRIAADSLPGRKKHPSPWARLERQFLIKLQGEDEPARWPTDAERSKFDRFAKEIGLKREDEVQTKRRRVDALMADAIAVANRGLRRHGTRAKIAFQLMAKKKPGMGGKSVTLDRQGRIDFLADTLTTWRDLATDAKWTDRFAAKLWDAHIKSLVQADEPATAGDSPQAKKRRREALKAWLRPAAERLVTNASLCSQLHALWAAAWSEEDNKWRKRVRWLRKWLLPRKKAAQNDCRQARRIGGLSITRLASIREVYHLLKAFHMRPEPDDLRKNIPVKGDDSLDKFGQRILDKLEHMRENRVKQCASRLVEAALGIGAEPGRGDRKKQLPRATTAKHGACHAVVIENLQNYRPDELQTRRENRQLMQWSAGKVRKYLEEGCSLHGLLLCEVSPSYTSRQDSRTGKPGVRCTDIPVEDFLTSHWLIKRAVKDILGEELPGDLPKLMASVKKAAKLAEQNNASPRNRYLLDLYCRWAAKPQKDRRDQAARVPMRGGEIFMTADSDSPIAGGLQADLNAAANIGLKALLDPDWPGAWWYVPCDAKTGKPMTKSTKGSTAIDADNTLAEPRSKGDGRVLNLWRDISAQSLSKQDCCDFDKYWKDVENGVESLVIARLRERAGLSLQPSLEDDNPF